jgi:hypothetical protein
MTKKVGLRAAINAKCKDCIYDPLSGLGTWRQQVEGCTCLSCPLWPIRPIAAGKKADLGALVEEADLAEGQP